MLEQAIAKQIKETLDKQCGTPWHCIIGEGFSYAVDAQVRMSKIPAALLWVLPQARYL